MFEANLTNGVFKHRRKRPGFRPARANRGKDTHRSGPLNFDQRLSAVKRPKTFGGKDLPGCFQPATQSLRVHILLPTGIDYQHLIKTAAHSKRHGEKKHNDCDCSYHIAKVTTCKANRHCFSAGSASFTGKHAGMTANVRRSMVFSLILEIKN